MESLLPYYERELTYLRRLSSDFAKKYPKVAGRLLLSGETCDDPHIERLIESFAFLTGRIHKKLDDDFPEITNSLLEVIYPHYLRPFPSASIACFNCGNAAAQLSQSTRIPRHTELKTRPVKGVACRFQTAYDIDIWPIRLEHAVFENAIDTSGLRVHLARQAAAAIRLDLSALSEQAGLDSLPLGKIRFFLNGDTSVVAMIREAVFSKAIGVWVSFSSSSEKIDLPVNIIQPVGFAEDEMLVAQDARTHRAYQLLMEYFAFPEKFNFMDIDLAGIAGRLPPGTKSIELRIGLARSRGNADGFDLLDRISTDNFVLGCAPVVNLFQKKAEPIRITGTSTSYPIIVDNRHSRAYDVYEITRVARVQQDSNSEEICDFKPFYSLRHGEELDGPARYWHASYIDDVAESTYSMEISLVDSTLDPQRPETNTLSLDLLCTNRDLPSQLPFGLPDGDLFIEGGSIAKTIQLLRKPTRSYRFPRGRGAQWRLISHLSLNHLSLSGSGVDAIREILGLYDITRASQNARQISGIAAIDHSPTMARMAGNPFPTFVRGMQIRLTVDESHYAGIGLFMYAQILDHFFGLYVHTNSFTQLSIVSRQTGQELIKCPARNGESILA
ncbi:type VI secretion system protein ImpG [Paucimonas lemoignei]|uniref:Type VI secretion system protein ImpG n=1 Tax=Paucimonas lemoignei TaxID=29443 RepID=A0A4R3I2L2_PAULE|nr:type VI secretion system baseplate subunit TssF [Paucimonas lemoignei]TCS39474.1 type VI secretion system protein ImpG [Paucimonas lemoignei]